MTPTSASPALLTCDVDALRFIAGWVARSRPALNLEDAWRIREACIAALSDPR